MSNSNDDERTLQWFKDSIEKLVDTKSNEDKASILFEIYGELTKLDDTIKIPKVRKRKEEFGDIKYPATVKEIVNIVKDASQNKNKIVRVIGSGHSVDDAISEDQIPGKQVVLVSLKKFHGIEGVINKQEDGTITVKVKAGTHLNKDPQDDSSTLENSLNYIINKKGYALPNLGGIARQTVGGFISTGSSGGSLKYSMEDSIIGITIIDGNGDIKELNNTDDKFFAAGVSMGLFGIITHVTFKLEPNYFIYGNQVIALVTPTKPDYQEGCPIDLLNTGDKNVPNLYTFFTKGEDYGAEYSRIYWWPQEDVKRLTIWKAKRTSVLDIVGFKKPILAYEELPPTFGSQVLTQVIVKIVYIVLNLLMSESKLYKSIASHLLNTFNGVSLQSFQDIWYNGLPMDDKISDDIIPTTFTELWFDLEKTQELMTKLNEHFGKGTSATGTNATELYTAKESKFWLSPSYNRKVVRIDFLYFVEGPRGTPKEFFEQFWKLFENYDYRCHWGKYVPDNYNMKVINFDKYSAWMAIRKEMDPNQIFVTPYWRKIFSIPDLK